jgi:hypothetical protein
MYFSGIKSEKDRADIISYLEKISGYGKDSDFDDDDDEDSF